MILMYELAQAAVLVNDIDTGLSIFHELRQMQVPPEPRLIRMVSQMQAYLRMFSSQLELAEITANETHRLCESAGDVWGQVDVAWIRALALLNLGRLGECLSIAREVVPLAERIGHWGCAWFCKQFLNSEPVTNGDLEGAMKLADELAEYDRLHYVPWSLTSNLELGNIARLRGRVEESVKWCESANVPERNHFGGIQHASLALTFAQAGDGRVSQALKDALRSVPRAGHPAPHGRWYTLNMVIEALAVAGLVEDAVSLHSVAEDMIGAGYAMMIAACALPRTTAGIAAACACQWSHAERHHQTAVHQADTMPHRVCQPIARYWYAEMLSARDEAGDTARAGALFNEALAMFESLGMPLYWRQTSERLAKLSI
jgi:hypothetical protein